MAPWDEINLTPSSPEPLPVHNEAAAYPPTPPPVATAYNQGYGQPQGYAQGYSQAPAASAYPGTGPYGAPPPVSAYPAQNTGQQPGPGNDWPARAPNPDSLLGRTAAKSQRAGDDPYATETIPSAHLRAIRRRGRMGWLMALLGFAALAAAVVLGLDDREKLVAAQAKQAQGLVEAQTRAEAAERARIEAERALATMKDEVAAKDTASGEDQKLIGALKGLLSSKEGEIEAAGKSVSVSLVDDVMFPSGKAELSLSGFRVLARVGKLLKETTDRQIVIGGHTDDRPLKKKGGFETNWELSAARAVNVVRYLVEEVGVDPNRISAAAYSQYKPRSKNLAKNRRIEVLLTPVLAVKPAK